MTLTDLLRSNGIVVAEQNRSGAKFRKIWAREFASSLNRSEKTAIYLDDFLWHVFSYQKLECLMNDAAIEAFDGQSKDACYVFYQNTDTVLLLENATNMKAELFANELDVYVTDTKFQWTYVKTHESGLGPYFYKPFAR